MDKGIRSGVNWKFGDLLPQLIAGTMTGKVFRKAILTWACEEYGCTMNAAATHYNFSKHQAVTAGAVTVDLGRPPEKNNGGRKKKVEGEFVGPVQPAAVEGEREVVEEQQTVFKVCKKADGTVIAEGLCFEDAKALVEKAAAAKKAKLYWV